MRKTEKIHWEQKCDYCKNPFRAIRSWAKFCGDRCRKKWNNELKAGRDPSNQVIEPRVTSKQVLHYHLTQTLETNPANQKPQKQCAFCGYNFHSKHGNQKYCTETCQKRMERKIHRLKAKAGLVESRKNPRGKTKKPPSGSRADIFWEPNQTEDLVELLKDPEKSFK